MRYVYFIYVILAMWRRRVCVCVYVNMCGCNCAHGSAPNGARRRRFVWVDGKMEFTFASRLCSCVCMFCKYVCVCARVCVCVRVR